MIQIREKIEALREQFKTETGENYINSQGEPDIEYIAWIEERLVKESGSLPCVSLRLFDSEMDELTKEIEAGYTDFKDDYKRHQWRCDQKRSMQITRNIIFPDAS